ncbi:MAG: cellulose biosynthesis cyclic di-GMP-binding regulatory protein BcsB [Chloroflexi bacterium]|nr:cellulose biosynthesis cyclic di-GMP-binding regulatory protein BcsB [Chloroflexota bacterium]
MTISIIPTASFAQENDPEPGACSNLLLNGDMEANHSWQLSSGSIASSYVNVMPFSGQQALLVGPPLEATIERNTLSTAWQAVRIPATEATTLSFWYRPDSERNPGSDRQYIGLIDTNGQIIDLYVNTLENKNAWQFFSTDVTRYAGRTLWIYFGVENDGFGGNTRLFVDNAQLCSQIEFDADNTSVTIPSELEVPTDINLPGAANIVTWEQFGFAEALLQGPYDAGDYRFGLPADWSLQSGAALSLDLHLFNPTAVLSSGVATDHPVGTLNARMNGIILPPIFLSGEGEQSFTIDLPDESLISYRSDGRHELVVGLESEQPCESETQISLLVKSTTQLLLPHEMQAPVTDLRLLPRPLYQDSFVEDAAILVVPAQPDPADLQAAMAVAAGFGRMTKGNLSLSLLTADLLNADVQSSAHLILVGSPADFDVWEQLSLPAPVVNGRFQAASSQPDDGIVQMAISPWNPTKVVMVVGGANDAGIIKAGQAVSSGILRVGAFPNMAVISDIQVSALPADVELIDETFDSLGYDTRELDDKGINYANYHFKMPAGHIIGNDAYFELFFNHSALLNFEQSGLIIDINGEQIGSVRFEDASTNLTQARFNIPRYAVHAGDNELLVKAELMPQDNCINPNFEGIWLSLSSDSGLHLPLTPSQGEARSSFDLDDYPTPFDYDFSLSNVMFVLPPDDMAAWQTAVQLVTDLGDRIDPPYAAMKVTFADNIPETERDANHFIIIGRPSQLDIIGELEDVMPAPFAQGSDLADENNQRVKFRLPADSEVGYLEFFPSPWNQNRVVLSVLGSSEAAVQWSASALIMPRLKGRLEGNLAIIQGEQIISELEQSVLTGTPSTSNSSNANDAAAETVAVEETEETITNPAIASFTVSKPDWLLPAVWIVSGLMGAVVLAAIISRIIISRRI